MKPSNESVIIDTEIIKTEQHYDEKTEMRLIDLKNGCIFSIFDFLSLSEVCSLSFTCQKMQKLSRDYFAQKYPNQWISIEIRQKNDSIVIAYSERNMKPLKYFSKCIRNVRIIKSKVFSNNITMDLQRLYDFLKSECSDKLHSLDLCFEVESRFDIDPPEDVKNQLKNVENIIVSKSHIHSIYHGLIKYCENVKCFNIKTPNADNWFQYKYPKLESLSLPLFHIIDKKKCSSIDTFFQDHQQIKEITCNGINMLEAVFRNFNQIDRLQANIELPDQLIGIIQHLKPKNTKKLYKWFGLSLTLPCIPDAGILNNLDALVPIHRLEFAVTLQLFGRTKLSKQFGTNALTPQISQPQFPHLKRLEELKMILSFKEMWSLNAMPPYFPNIKRLELVIDHLYLCENNSLLFRNAMVPLVRDLLQMEMLTLRFEGGTMNKVIFDAMDLVALESIRRSVSGASNLKIHIKYYRRDLRQMPQFQSPENMVTINFDIHKSSMNC